MINLLSDSAAAGGIYLSLELRSSSLDALEVGVVHVVKHDCRTIVLFGSAETDILHNHVLSVTDVESPGRKFLELGEFGICLRHFRHVVQFLGGDVGVIRVSAAREFDLHILERNVSHVVARKSYDAARQYVARLVLEGRSLVVLVAVRLRCTNLGIDVPDGNVVDIAALVDALSNYDEDGVCSIERLESVHNDILCHASVNCLDCDG